jgi:hypothetical protein
MESREPFSLFDCSLARYAAGLSCSNLRELLDAIRTVPDMVLEHHMMRCALEDYFELYEFPNDLARWCWEALGDRMLAEELSLVDPYSLSSTSDLRTSLINTIEEQLWGVDHLHRCRPGLELHFVGSRLVAYDTGERIPTPAALAEMLPRMPLRSVFYHVHVAHQQRKVDDFTAWLEAFGVDASLVHRLRTIDFYFLNLNQVRNEFAEAFRLEQQVDTPSLIRASSRELRNSSVGERPV